MSARVSGLLDGHGISTSDLKFGVNAHTIVIFYSIRLSHKLSELSTVFSILSWQQSSVSVARTEYSCGYDISIFSHLIDNIL